MNPGLADRIIDQRDNENRREHTSYRFGLVATAIIVSAISAACLIGVLFAGLLQTLILVAAILAVAVLVRVVLTGEWSETTWFGSLIHLLARALGSERNNDGGDDAPPNATS